MKIETKLKRKRKMKRTKAKEKKRRKKKMKNKIYGNMYKRQQTRYCNWHLDRSVLRFVHHTHGEKSCMTPAGINLTTLGTEIGPTEPANFGHSEISEASMVGTVVPSSLLKTDFLVGLFRSFLKVCIFKTLKFSFLMVNKIRNSRKI